MIIKKVVAREIKDSRGETTIEVSVNGASTASSPSGKSTGAHETKPYYKNIDFCISFLNSFEEKIEVNAFDDLAKVEAFLQKKLKLKHAREFGGNALFAFESAILKALAKEEKKELWQVVNHRAKTFPRPVGNAIGGGLHTHGKLKPFFQEFLIIPNEKSFADNVKVMKEIYSQIGKSLNAKEVNDEGAWNAQINDEQALKQLSTFSNKVSIGIDMAANSFYRKGFYDYGTRERSAGTYRDYILPFIKQYGVFYMEDPMHEEDFENFAFFKKSYREAMIVGDDLTATQIDRVKEAIEKRSVGGVIVKPNQNGSLLEVKEIMELCRKHKLKTIMSHRSGETMDDALADYAFAFGADFIKCGIATKWREAKLKRMIDIEKSL